MITSLPDEIEKTVPWKSSAMLRQTNMTDNTTMCDRSIPAVQRLETSPRVAGLETMAAQNPLHAASIPPCNAKAAKNGNP